jgi:hypothetical protein
VRVRAVYIPKAQIGQKQAKDGLADDELLDELGRLCLIDKREIHRFRLRNLATCKQLTHDSPALHSLLTSG